MSQPKFTDTGSGYRFEWEEEEVAIDIRKIYEHRDGRTTAEITVTTSATGYAPHLLYSTFNLSTPRSRGELGKELAKRYKKKVNWDELLEQLCVLSLGKYREGEPAYKLYEIPPRVKPRYRVSPIIFENEANVIFGDGETGKTHLACWLAVQVQDNVAAANMTPHCGNVLFLDWETSGETTREIVQAIRRGFDIPIPNEGEDIVYRHCTQPLVNDIEYVQTLVAEHNIEFVITDSVEMACGGDSDKSDSVKAYYRALRSLGITSLSIDHISKGSDGKAPYGSAFRRNIPRSQFLVKHDQEPGEHHMTIGLYHKKCNIAPKIKPIGFRVDFTMNGAGLDKITFGTADLLSSPELAEGLPLKDRIKAVLRHGKMEVKDIAEELGEGEAKVRARLNENKRLFQHYPDGWGLLTNE